MEKRFGHLSLVEKTSPPAKTISSGVGAMSPTVDVTPPEKRIKELEHKVVCAEEARKKSLRSYFGAAAITLGFAGAGVWSGHQAWGHFASFLTADTKNPTAEQIANAREICTDMVLNGPFRQAVIANATEHNPNLPANAGNIMPQIAKCVPATSYQVAKQQKSTDSDSAGYCGIGALLLLSAAGATIPGLRRRRDEYNGHAYVLAGHQRVLNRAHKKQAQTDTPLPPGV